MPADNLVFSMQTLFSFTALLFCCIMLGTGKEPSYYLPVLTSNIGYWLPSPRGSAAGMPTVRSLPALFMRRQPSTPADRHMDRMESGLAPVQAPPSPLPTDTPQPSQPSPPAPPPAQPSPPPPPPQPSPPAHPAATALPPKHDKAHPMRLVKFDAKVAQATR